MFLTLQLKFKKGHIILVMADTRPLALFKIQYKGYCSKAQPH